MPEMIKDGTGAGYLVKVDNSNRIFVRATVESLHHTMSHDSQQSFQVIGTATPVSGTVVVLHIKNTSSTKSLSVSRILHQVVDAANGTAFPSANSYLSVRLGRIYSTGGSTATPVNMYNSSGVIAEATCYHGGPTLTGTASEIDRWYTKEEAEVGILNGEHSLILGPSGTMEVSYVSDHTAGTVYAMVGFAMITDEE